MPCLYLFSFILLFILPNYCELIRSFIAPSSVEPQTKCEHKNLHQNYHLRSPNSDCAIAHHSFRLSRDSLNCTYHTYQLLPREFEQHALTLEPFIQVDKDLFYANVGVAHDTDRRQWTDLVQIQKVAFRFYGGMSAFLGAWANTVYSTTNITTDLLSRATYFVSQELMHCDPQKVLDNTPSAAATVVRRRDIQYFDMADASLDGTGGVIMMDLALIFSPQQNWRTDNLSVYLEYV